MVERLKLNYKGSDGLIFENVAISEKVEQRALYRVSQKTIDAHKLPDWLKGMSTFSDAKLKEYQEHVEAQPVSCVPLRSLLDKHSLPRVDVLQIDTEGFDYQVFKQFDFSAYRPAIVNIEVVNLKPEELKALQGDLAGLGYIYFQYEMDLMALDLGFFNSRMREHAGRVLPS
jgi:FkbM family methyltransferase